jgi:hypothetical protein
MTREGNKKMKRSISACVLTLASVLMAVAVDGVASAQAAKPKPKATSAAPAGKPSFTSQQAAALKLAWDNLWRGYADLLATPPDVKGDTSKLEGHMKAAMDLLHQVDPKTVPEAPSTIPELDKGHTRSYIIDATKGHLEKAKRVIEGANVSSPYIKEALDNIAVAENELAAAAQAAPVK